MKKILIYFIISIMIFGQKEIRVGFFPNITHGQALYGKNQKIFEKNMKNVKISWKKFNGGPEAMEAFLAKQVDIGYIGPGPALNGYIKTKGDIFIISGAANAGAVLVVGADTNIKTLKDLNGKKIAIPQIGNTQDIVLRYVLKKAGLKPSYKGGTVEIVHSNNPYIKTLLDNKNIDGALVPEPWGTRLVQESNARILLDAKELYNNGDYPTTVIIVRKEFYEKNKDLVKEFIKTHIQITKEIQKNQNKAKQIINNEIKEITGKALKASIINESFKKVIFTYNPEIEATNFFLDLQIEAGFIRKRPDISALFDLTILNSLIKETH